MNPNKGKPAAGGSPTELPEIGMRTTLIAESYNAGESVGSLVQRYAVTVATVLDHLTRYVAAGNSLRSGSDLQAYTSTSPDEQQAVMEVFDEIGSVFLKPVHERLGGKIDYDELRILRLMYLSRDE